MLIHYLFKKKKKASHKTPALKSKLEDCSRNSLCRELPLEVFLIKPIQRVCEYPGQLSRMLKVLKTYAPPLF